MVHHPLVAAAGAVAGVAAGGIYARRRKLPFRATADALAPPLVLGLAFEQAGALAAGSGFGIDAGAGLRWAVTYTSPLAARWSGTPLGVPLHPVQAYAALAFLTLAILLLVWLPSRRQEGEWPSMPDGPGRGDLPDGNLARYGRARLGARGRMDGPQIAAIAMVLAGALILRERKRRIEEGGFPICFARRRRKGWGTGQMFFVDEARPEAGRRRRAIRARSELPAEARGIRLDRFLAAQMEGVSRCACSCTLSRAA